MNKRFTTLASLAMLAGFSWAFLAAPDSESESGAEPQDMTSRIANPNFNDGKTGWSGDWGNGGHKATSINPLFTSNNSTFDVYQDIKGLPNGRYKLKVQAFTRPMTHDNLKTAIANGETLNNQTYFYANETSKLVKLITEETSTDSNCGDEIETGKRIPNKSDQAAYAFNAGMYENELEFVVNDSTVRIGIRQESTNGTTYVGYDNFRLYYLGELSSITEEQKTEILASVPTGAMNASVSQALSKAVQAFQEDASVENYNALGQAIADAKASIQAYSAVKEALDKAANTTLSDKARAQYNAAVAIIIKAYDEATITGDGSEEVTAIGNALAEAIKLDVGTSAIDMTSKIANPNFSDSKNGWSGDFGTGAVKATSINPLITAYGGTFDIYQDIENLPNGTYKVQVQAFTRPLDHDDMVTSLGKGETLANETYFYANNTEKLVKLIVEEWGTTSAWGKTFETGKYVPNSSNDAASAFNAGLYENELTCVVTDGTLRIGIRQDATSGKPYVGYDNFRLTYVSTDTTLPEPEKEPLTAKDIQTYAKNCNTVAAQAIDHSAFDEAYAAAIEALKVDSLSEAELQSIKANVTTALAHLLKNGETESGQFDLTSLITNATFTKNLDGWNTDKPFSWNSIGVAQFSNANKGGNLSQILPGMPAGKYTLKVQGFYRQSGWKEGLYEYEHGNVLQKLQLVLNDSKKPIKSLFEDGRSMLASANISRTEDVGCTIDGRGFPHLMSKVQDIFTPGHYWNYLEATIAEDGDLTLGASLEATDREDNWAVLDNFRLYYGDLKPVVVSSKNYRAKDDTPAEVKIVKKLTADALTPFSAPCDIPGSCFKAVYEIGALKYDKSQSSMTIYPVEKVRAGVPCFVVSATDMDTIFVGKTVFSAKDADATQLIWDGGLITPLGSTFTWRNVDLDNTNRASALFKNPTYVELNDMNFNANLENFQVRRFLKLKYTQSSSSAISNYNQPAPARRDVAHSVGIPVPASKSEGAVVLYSVNEDMSEAKQLPVYYGASVCYIPNLIPGTTYYYEVKNQEETISKGKFTTEGPLRQLYTPSIYNIRDFGGWTMSDGRITRYGLIYRGGEVNGYHAPYQKDVETLKELGIGAEIDLRYNDSYDQDRETNKSGFGFTKGETYYFAGANDYTAANISEAATQARLKEEFRFLLDHIRNGRGVYFHCVFGADRTGFFAVLLEGLLGFTLNDMYHDYEFTSFAAPAGNRNKSSIQERIAVIQALTGKTLRDKFENYWLNSVGITAEEIEEFRNIMLYEPTPDAIQDVVLDEANGGNEIQAVYNLDGTKVSASQMNSKRGIYVIQYKNGQNKKVATK